MSSVLLELADAVASELNSPVLSDAFMGWSQNFQAVRKNVLRFDAADMADLHVTVRTKDRVTNRIARGVMRDTMRVDIGIQRKCVSDENSESDPLIELGEQIQAYFDQKRSLQEMPPVICEASAFGANADSAWISVLNQNGILLYTGLVLLTFGANRRGQA